MTCQPHPYYMATVRGYLAVYGWKNTSSDIEALVTKKYQVGDSQYDAYIFLQLGRSEETHHTLSAVLSCNGRNILSECRTFLLRTEPVFATTISQFVQGVDAAIAAYGS